VTSENQSVEAMTISADGKWLFYDSNQSGNADIYKAQLDAGVARDPVRLTSDRADDFAPQISADGRDVVFYSMRSGTRDVFVVRSDGTGSERVTNLPGQEFHPSWAPDGRIILTYGDPAGVYSARVTSRTADGSWSVPGLLFDNLQPVPTHALGNVEWSPDGKNVLVELYDSLLVVGVDTRERRLLSLVPPDGSVLVHLPLSNGGKEFWSVPLGRGTPRLLLRLDDPTKRSRRNEFATDGKHLYFTIASDEADVRMMMLKRE
jgi:hypothetical protein